MAIPLVQNKDTGLVVRSIINDLVNYANNNSITGSLKVTGSLNVSGTTTFTGSVYISGSNTLFNTGPTTLSGSLAQGMGPFFVSKYAHAEGYQTSASGIYSHAEGYRTTSKNTGSHAEGNNTISSGSYSHAEGQGTQALGISSHAEGINTYALGDYSHAEGASTNATGPRSHAEGIATVAIGTGSHVGGYGTYAYGDYQTVVGQYNTLYNYGDLFVVGDGAGFLNRKDVLKVSSSLVTINNLLTLTSQHPLPASAPTGTFAVSASTPPKPYFYDGTNWNALY